VGVQMLVFCLVWQVTGWPPIMGLGLLLGAIFGSIACLTGAPLALLKKMSKTLAITMTVAGVYIAGVLPAVSSFPTLSLALLPAFYLLGIQVLKPGGILFGVLPIALMQLEDKGPGITVDALLSSVIAIYIGVGTAVIAHTLVRQPNVAESVQRLMRATERGLLGVIDRRTSADAFVRDAWDRFLLIQTRLSSLPDFAERHPGLQTLRISRIARDVDLLSRPTGRASGWLELTDAVLHSLRAGLPGLASRADAALVASSSKQQEMDTALNRIQTIRCPAENFRLQRAILEIQVALDALNPARNLPELDVKEEVTSCA
jgi:hypothetical protein